MYLQGLHHWHKVQYIRRNMHTVFALLCFVVVIHRLIFPYPSGLLHWHCGNLTIAPVPAKQPWWIWINTSCEFIMNNCITTTKQSTTKPCAYFLGYTVVVWLYQCQWSDLWNMGIIYKSQTIRKLQPICCMPSVMNCTLLIIPIVVRFTHDTLMNITLHTLQIIWFGIHNLSKRYFHGNGVLNCMQPLVFGVIYIAPSGESEIIHPRVRAGGKMITLAITSSWNTKCPAIYQDQMNSQTQLLGRCDECSVRTIIRNNQSINRI